MSEFTGTTRLYLIVKEQFVVLWKSHIVAFKETPNVTSKFKLFYQGQKLKYVYKVVYLNLPNLSNLPVSVYKKLLKC